MATERTADIERLFVAEYASLVRLAALLLDEPGAREEVVQEAFVRLHARWTTLRDEERALAYLRRTVVNLSRSRLRRRLVAAKHRPLPQEDAPSAHDVAAAHMASSAVLRELRNLPRRQREVLVLRYYGGLSEADIAAVLGISAGSVKGYASRGLASLRTRVEER